MNSLLVVDFIYILSFLIFISICFKIRKIQRNKILGFSPSDTIRFKLALKDSWKIAPFLIFIFLIYLVFLVQKITNILQIKHAFGDSAILLTACFTVYSFLLVSEVILVKITLLSMRMKFNS